jgi:hypothetical protein
VTFRAWEAFLATLLLSRGVPITYVSAQLGHAKPTTTLQWYSHWLPAPDAHRFVDGLDRPSKFFGTKFGTKEARCLVGEKASNEKAPDFSGAFWNGPPQTRTGDPLIKSQLL